MAFATAPVARRTLRASVPASGTLRAAADAEVYVSAPIAGHLITHGDAFPPIGKPVQRGETLAIIVPRLGGETDIASLELAVQKTRSFAQLATYERQRLEQLLSQDAVPARRINQARNQERVARAELKAAERRLNQYQRKSEEEASGVPVPAPITGTIARVDVAAGSYLEAGQSMFYIVNLERLWLEARIAEADIGQVRRPTGAMFRVAGFEPNFEIRPGENGHLVSLGRMVDPVSRTLSIVYEFVNPDKTLPIGMYAHVRVLTGETSDGLAVPVSAVVDDSGQDVVFVQLGGESFERRVVQLGFRDGDYVQVRSGLVEGERIVTQEAYLVRLAAASPAEGGHAH